jgi:putative aldouronate transport system substrate-binding protein
MLVGKNAEHGTFSEMRIFKVLEQLTNVHISFIEVPSQGFNERKNLILATGDLPDLFWGNTINANDEDIYGPQGAFVPLNALIDSDAPHVKAAMVKYPLLRKTMTASDGKIYALGRAGQTPTMGPFKMRINKTWLAKLGLKMPETIDDVYAALKAFVTRDPNGNGKADEIGITHYGMDNIDATFLGAFGYSYGYTEHQRIVNVIDSKVVFFRGTPAYKAYLQWMTKLYKENLLDHQVFSQTEDEYAAKTGKNVCGILSDIDDADYRDYEMVEPVTSSWNKTKLTWPLQRFASSAFTITRVNKYPKESIRWADIFYRDVSDPWNGFSGVSAWLGQQGVDWDYTDSTRKAVKQLFAPLPNMNQAVSFTKIIGPGSGLGMVIIDAPFTGDILGWAAEQNKKHLFPYQNDDMVYPAAVRFDKGVADRAAILSTDLKKYTEEMQAKFIAGEESFDRWDAYLAALKNIGVDEYLSILQKAYDKFNK